MAKQKEGMTIAEILWRQIKGEEKQPNELKVYNPLGVKLGDFAGIDIPDLMGKNFRLTEIDVWKKTYDGKTFLSVDYVLRENDNWIWIRLVPITDANPSSPVKFNVLVLSPHKKELFQKDLYEELYEKILPSGILTVHYDDKTEITYQRLYGKTGPDRAEVTVVDSKDQAPRVEQWSEWDFGREIQGGASEYYFVQFDESKGETYTYRGSEVSMDEVKFYPAGNPK